MTAKGVSWYNKKSCRDSTVFFNLKLKSGDQVERLCFSATPENRFFKFMRRTFKYKIKMNKTAEANCLEWLDLCRQVYNLCLEQRILVYRQWKKTLSRYDQSNQLPEFKNAFPEFKKMDAQCLRQTLQRVDEAYKHFFRRVKTKKGKAGFPRFKGKNRYDSFTLLQNSWKLEGKYLTIRNIGKLKLFLSRPIQGRIKTITIKRTPTNKWFAFFSCDNVPAKEFPETTAEIGIDLGISSFLTDSNGRKVENPKFFRKTEKLLRRRQRSLCRKKRGSNRRKKARLLVAKAHEKVSDQRNDFLHKTANYYVENFKKIYIEKLNIKNMTKNHRLSKAINDCSWGIFAEMLTFKVEETGKSIIKVNPKNTSQICSQCGAIVKKSLAVRVHRCPYCKLVICRDENAANNILIKGSGESLQASTFGLPKVA